YDRIASKVIPKRFKSPENGELIRKRHMELAGRQPDEMRRVLLDFVQSRPLYGMTIFNVMTPLFSYPFRELVSYRPGTNCILIVTERPTGTAKYVLTTEQSFTIAALINDYRDIQFEPAS
ncbi:cytochrome c oxidase subunit 1, partial [Cladochytrium tenue]